MSRYIYKLHDHSHGDHHHFNLVKESDHHHDHDHNHHHHHHHDDHGHHDHDRGNCDPCDEGHGPALGRGDEGCPCCAAAIDLDEVATAINEIKSNSGNSAAQEESESFVKLADFSTSAHWGIFLGIAGPLALVGLTAAYRNIKGTINNKSKLKTVIEGLDKDISRYKKERDNASGEDKEKLTGVVQRLEAFRNTLKYSKFDANFNLVVPGVINGVASTAVLSTAVLTSPAALPVIALYAGCQTVRNGYDLWRTWNEILPQDLRPHIQVNMKAGVRKVNQITDSKRKFYAANSLGFATFAAGATVTGLAATSLVGAPAMFVGIPLLAAGAVATGITNNIWTNKFKPRNAELGIDRIDLDTDSIIQEIGERRALKKILKSYRKKHLPNKSLKKFGASLAASLPFLDKYGARKNHSINQARIAESKSTDSDIIDLLERVYNAKKILKENDVGKSSSAILEKIIRLEKISEREKGEFDLEIKDIAKPTCKDFFDMCQKLGIEGEVLDKFIKNSILKSADEHDTSIKTKEDFFKKLTESGAFTVDKNEKITFDINKIQSNEKLRKAFTESLEEYLLFDYVEKLKYEQYGLNDFYWTLKKQNKNRPQSDYNKPTKRQGSKKSGPLNEGRKSINGQSLQAPIKDERDTAPDPIRDEVTTPNPRETQNIAKKRRVEKETPSINNEDIAVQEARLNQLHKLSKQEIATDPQQRKQQVNQQNQIVDKVLQKGRKFILESKTKNPHKNQTIFIYTDPDHQDPQSQQYDSKKVVYVRDDSTGKIDVFYGQKASAIIVEKADHEKNAAAVKINHNKIKHYGQRAQGIFRSFSSQHNQHKNSPNTQARSPQYRQAQKENDNHVYL